MKTKLFLNCLSSYMIFIMKVRVPAWRLLLILLVVIVFGAGVVFGFTFNMFLKPIKEWTWQPYAIIIVWFVISTFLIVAALLGSYYEVEKKYVVVHKGAQKLVYNYSDVVYIDEEQSVKKKMVCFYTRQGHCRYLMFDKKGILYKVMIANCKDRLSKEEFQARYPQVKL